LWQGEGLGRLFDISIAICCLGLYFKGVVQVFHSHMASKGCHPLLRHLAEVVRHHA